MTQKSPTPAPLPQDMTSYQSGQRLRTWLDQRTRREPLPVEMTGLVIITLAFAIATVVLVLIAGAVCEGPS